MVGAGKHDRLNLEDNMQTIRSREAFYPSFTLGARPSAIPCTISEVEANGKRYIRTPFAFLDSHGSDDLDRQIGNAVGKYYEHEADCMTYLAGEYPWADLAEPIMDALLTARHYHGDIVGPCRVADKCECTVDEVYQLARGHKRFGRKRVREAVAKLA